MAEEISGPAYPDLSGTGVTDPKKVMEERIQKIVDAMHDDYAREITLEELAKSVNLSVWHLSHLFKAQVGASPARYLKRLRLERAKVLLEDSFLSIKEVIAKVGMTDPSHFTKDFKKACGLTPTQYRATLQRSNGRHYPRLSGESQESLKGSNGRQLSLIDLLDE